MSDATALAPNPPEALIFDVFGTVVDWRRGIAEAVAEALPGEPDPAGFADAWRAKYQPAMEAVRSGARPYAALDVLHRENLDATLAERGLGGALGETEKAALNRAWERLPAWSEAPAALARLRRRFLLATCSNGSIALMSRLARYAGLGWDAIVGAEVARAYKPDPRAYLASAEALGLPPERVTMVAAHNGDLFAARSAGLRTAFFPRPAEHGPGQTTDLAAEAAWDVAAADMADLADRLGC